MAVRLIHIIFLFTFCLNGQAQQLQVLSEKEAWEKEVRAIINDSLNEKSLSWRLQEAGFWLYQIDSNQLNTGPKLLIGELVYEDEERLSPGLSLNDSNFKAVLSQELKLIENQGYPFASFQLRDYSIEKNRLQAQLILNRGPLIRFDSLVLLSYDGTNRKFIEREADWRKGRPYSSEYLEQVNRNLKRLEFIQFERNPALAFFPAKARVYLYLKKRSANLINGVVGLNTDGEGSSPLTGDFQLRLLNTFKRGEEINLQWRSPGNQAQDFNLSFAYPYLWNSPLGLKIQLEIFRQDSSFLRRDIKLSLPYRLAPGSHFKVSGQYFSTNPLGLNPQSELQIDEVTSYRFNLGFDLDRRNNPIVSTEGYLLDLELGSGRRTSNMAESTQYLWQGQFQYFLAFQKRWVWHQDFSSLGMTGSDLQDNEIFRLGGLKNLRGFNEWSFFTPAYALMRSEVRFMLGQYDYLSAFADLAFNEVDRKNQSPWDRHSGLGLGLNFQTKGGIFSLFLAVGQSNNSSYDFRSGKIHLAYLNRF